MSDHESDLINDNVQNVDLTNELKGTAQADIILNNGTNFNVVDNITKEQLNGLNNQNEDSNGLDNEQIENTQVNNNTELKEENLHGNAIQHDSTLNNLNDIKQSSNEMVCTPAIVNDEHSSYTETESPLTESPQHETPITPIVDRSRRVNPFNSLEKEAETGLWQAQKSNNTSDLDKMIQQHANSISPKKVASIPKTEETVPTNDQNEIYVAQFELMPQKTAKSQMEHYDFSSLEDVEAAVREVKLQNNHHKTPSPIDSPWVKIPQSTPPPPIEPSQDIPNITQEVTSPYNSIPNLPKKQEALKIDSPFINPNKTSSKPETSQPLVRPLIEAPGPCDPEDLIEGIIFTANYLGSTQLISEKNQGKNSRMLQAQEAVGRIKAPEGESQPSVEVDLFVSADKVKIMNADTQETMMDHSLRSISYIADIGKLLVIMAKRKQVQVQTSDEPQLMREPKPPRSYKIICHVFSSMDSQLMAQAIGQAFNVAYQQFLTANGIEPQTLTRDDYNKLLDLQEMYHDDLVHYSKQENIKDMWIEKKKGENLGVVIVESGWGSIVPTVILANLQHGGPAERCGKLSIGDQIMTINGTSLVGLSLTTCQSIIKGLRMQSIAHLNIVSCPPVVTVLIKRPDLKYQLGFSVQEGIICSLMRGGIAERGGVRVGHRIIEINGLSVVATQHDKIVQMLVSSVGEIQMKTMPATMYRLLTGQEQPVYI